MSEKSSGPSSSVDLDEMDRLMDDIDHIDTSPSKVKAGKSPFNSFREKDSVLLDQNKDEILKDEEKDPGVSKISPQKKNENSPLFSSDLTHPSSSPPKKALMDDLFGPKSPAKKKLEKDIFSDEDSKDLLDEGGRVTFKKEESFLDSLLSRSPKKTINRENDLPLFGNYQPSSKGGSTPENGGQGRREGSGTLPKSVRHSDYNLFEEKSRTLPSPRRTLPVSPEKQPDWLEGPVKPLIKENASITAHSESRRRRGAATKGETSGETFIDQNKKINWFPKNAQVSVLEADPRMGELQVKLMEAEVKVSGLSGKVEILTARHKEEVELLEDSHRRKMKIEEEVWERTERRLREESEEIKENLERKINDIQEEMQIMKSHHQERLKEQKQELVHVLEDAKKDYNESLQRVKEEHKLALERFQELKELELKAAVLAGGHTKEIGDMAKRLENNVSILSDLTTAVGNQNEASVEATHSALRTKEKHLEDVKKELSLARAEAESERATLRALVMRLEESLAKQGAEVQIDMAQQRVETEKARFAETKFQQHQQIEQMKCTLALEKEQLEDYLKFLQAKGFCMGNELTTTPLDLEIARASLKRKEQELDAKLQQMKKKEDVLKSKETDFARIMNELECQRLTFEMEKAELINLKALIEERKVSIEAKKREADKLSQEQAFKLEQIISATKDMHEKQNKFQQEREHLLATRLEIIKLLGKGQCPDCTFRGTVLGRVPGDGGEITSPKSDLKKGSLSPSSVLTRLAAAREKEKIDGQAKNRDLSSSLESI